MVSHVRVCEIAGRFLLSLICFFLQFGCDGEFLGQFLEVNRQCLINSHPSQGWRPWSVCGTFVWCSLFSSWRLGKWSLTLIFFIFIFWQCLMAHGILILWPGIKPVLPALEGKSLNCWTTTEVWVISFPPERLSLSYFLNSSSLHYSVDTESESTWQTPFEVLGTHQRFRQT